MRRMYESYAPEPVPPCTKAAPGERCPEHPYSKLTALGCVMCGGAKNAERDRRNNGSKNGKPKFVMHVPERKFGM